MKIYKTKSGGFWFAQTKENGWFCFSSTPPDINTLNLYPGMFGNEEEQTAWNEGVDIPKDVEVNVFNKFAKKKYNYTDVCEFIKKYYPNTTQEELDKEYDHYPELIELTNQFIQEYNGFINEFFYRQIYQDVRLHMREWDNDIERVKKYVIEHDIPSIMSFDNTMVDVFGECHPTKRFLLHEFYNHWGKKLDSLIDKAIELYPDNKDYDKAYYFVKDKLHKE
jgi:hypothetical protein